MVTGRSTTEARVEFLEGEWRAGVELLDADISWRPFATRLSGLLLHGLARLALLLVLVLWQVGRLAPIELGLARKWMHNRDDQLGAFEDQHGQGSVWGQRQLVGLEGNGSLTWPRAHTPRTAPCYSLDACRVAVTNRSGNWDETLRRHEVEGAVLAVAQLC